MSEKKSARESKKIQGRFQTDIYWIIAVKRTTKGVEIISYLSDESVVQLTIAVHRQNHNDYREARERINNPQNYLCIKFPTEESVIIDAERTISEIERFYQSQYGDLLSFGQARYILDKLRAGK